mmetsp:Transcript_14739/g.23044  ORF Transcript_14739/g.23044 Transcript_14739/m.23044 type:complete len:421 (+) Transcript_14739:45-1307(+)
MTNISKQEVRKRSTNHQPAASSTVVNQATASPAETITVIASKRTPGSSVGVSFESIDGKLYVSNIACYSPFCASQLQVGCEVIAINGIDCEGIKSASEAFIRAAKGSIAISVKASVKKELQEYFELEREGHPENLVKNPASPTVEWMRLDLPHGQNWYSGMQILDESENVLFVVLKKDGIKYPHDVFLTDPDDNILASIHIGAFAVQRRGEAKIYTCFPAYEGQKPAIRLDDDEQLTTPLFGKRMYLSGYYSGGFVRSERDKRDWKQHFIKSELSCSNSSSLDAVKFPSPSRPEYVLVTRDEKKECLSVAPGQNLLISVCLAYIVDRLHKPLEKQHSNDNRISSQTGTSISLRNKSLVARKFLARFGSTIERGKSMMHPSTSSSCGCTSDKDQPHADAIHITNLKRLEQQRRRSRRFADF